MAEEKNNPTPEELRRQIQERLESMKKASMESEEQKQTEEKQTETKEEGKTQVETKVSEQQKTEAPKAAVAKETEKPQPKEEPQKVEAKKPEVKQEKASPAEESAPKIVAKPKKELGGTPKTVKTEAKTIKKTEPLVPKEKKELGGKGLEKKQTPKVEKADAEKKTLGKSTPLKKSPTTTVPVTNETESKGNKKGMILLLIVLLIGVVGLFTWQLVKTNELKSKNTAFEKEVNKLETEKAKIQKELKALYADYENVSTNNKALQQQLDDEKKKIAEYLEQIQKLEGQASKMAYYRRQVLELRKSKEKFVAQIDSLTQANKTLIDANTKMSDEINIKNTENQELSGQVETAKRLKGYNLTIEALNQKMKETSKGKKVDEFKICIILMENELAEAGPKDIFVRIVSPSGDILVKSPTNLFTDMYENEIAYSAVSTIDYQNARIKSCVSYNGMYGELAPGKYDVEVYTDGQKIAFSSISLK